MSTSAPRHAPVQGIGPGFYWKAKPAGRRVASLRSLVVTFMTIFCGGCTTLHYYGQAIHGHAGIMLRTRPIDRLLRDDTLDPQLRRKLDLVRAARAFASDHLALPDNGSYASYADLGRDYVVWNVFAAPILSLDLAQSCFPFVGCLPYRGYFNRQAALAHAARLKAEGYDVYVGGVAAYSTLGWFNDPILNTMTRWDDGQLIKVIFHELAHQRVYCRDDADFNEAFATAVSRLGYRLWLERASFGQPRLEELDEERRDEEFVRLLLTARTRLQSNYESDLDDADKLATKEATLRDLRETYSAWRSRWNGYPGYDAWLEQDLNNAKLASIATYYDLVPAFERLFQTSNANFTDFHLAVDHLTRLAPNERSTCLQALARAESGVPDSCDLLAARSE